MIGDEEEKDSPEGKKTIPNSTTNQQKHQKRKESKGKESRHQTPAEQDHPSNCPAWFLCR